MTTKVLGTTGIEFPDSTVQSTAAKGLVARETKTATGLVGGLNFAIPSWAKKITLAVQSLSTNGTSGHIVQLGIGTPQTSGYAAQGSIGNAGNTVITTGLPIMTSGNAANVVSGVATFVLHATGVWSYSSAMSFTNGTSPVNVAGGISPAFASPIDLLRIDIGANTFDSGSATVVCEG